jgi:hypothetical protein
MLPKRLFLIDSLGAFVTAVLLYVVIRIFNPYFGMPVDKVKILSIIALIFCTYSMTCFFLLKNNWKPFLKIISIANLFYCCVTMALIIHYYPVLTTLGVIYFSGEILIISTLAFIEWKTVATNK